MPKSVLMKFQYLFTLLLILAFFQSANASCWGTFCDLCNTKDGGATLECVVINNRNTAATRITQTDIDSFWSTAPLGGVTKVDWYITDDTAKGAASNLSPNVETATNNVVNFIGPAIGSGIEWNLSVEKFSTRSDQTYLRADWGGSNNRLKFVPEGGKETVTNITIDSRGVNHQADLRCQATAAQQCEIDIQGDLKVLNGAVLDDIKYIKAGSFTMESTMAGRTSILRLRGDMDVAGDITIKNGSYIPDNRINGHIKTTNNGNFTIDSATAPANGDTYIYYLAGPMEISGDILVKGGPHHAYVRGDSRITGITANNLKLWSIGNHQANIHNISGAINVAGTIELLAENTGTVYMRGESGAYIDGITARNITLHTKSSGEAYIYHISGPVNADAGGIRGDIELKQESTGDAYLYGADEWITGIKARNLTLNNTGPNAWTQIINMRNGNIDVSNDFKILGRYSRLNDFRNGDIIVGGNFEITGPTYQSDAGIVANSRFNNITVGGDLTLQNKRIYYVDGLVDVGGAMNLTTTEIHGKASFAANQVNMTNSNLYCNGDQHCKLNASGDISISGKGPSNGQSTMYFEKIETTNGGKFNLSNAALISNSNHLNAAGAGIFIDGVAGTDSWTMDTSEIHFNKPAPIRLSNGNALIVGRYPSNYATYYSKDIEVMNGNLTVKRGAETGRRHSLWAISNGRIYASGDILFEDVLVDGTTGYITSVESALGDITFTRSELRTLWGPLRAINGRITFTGTAITDDLIHDNAWVGIYANEFFVNNAQFHDLTYNSTNSDPSKYGAIEISGLMSLTNADLTNSWGGNHGNDIRWIHAGALEMADSQILTRGNIIIQDYLKMVNSRIRLNDNETIDDPTNSLIKIEVVNPVSQSYGIYIEGMKNSESIEANWDEPLSVANKGDSSHPAIFKDTKIENTGQALTLETCQLEVTGTFETFSNAGTLITGSASDPGKINMTTALAWSQHSCGAPGSISCSLTPNPATHDSTAFNSTITADFVGAVPNGTTVNINCGNGTSTTATVNSLQATGTCSYIDSGTASQVFNVVASSSSPVVQCSNSVFQNFGGGGPGGGTAVPTTIAIGAFILDKATKQPINSTAEIFIDITPGGSCASNPITTTISDGILNYSLSGCLLVPGAQYIAQVTIDPAGANETINVSFYP